MSITPLNDIYDESAWVKTADLYQRFDSGITDIIFELADGREAQCDYIGPMVGGIQISSPTVIYTSAGDINIEELGINPSELGAVYTSVGIGDGNDDIAIHFSKGYPEYLGMASGTYLDVFYDWHTELPYDHLAPDAVTRVTRGCVPFLRKVYNFEVEDFHTYYVGEMGVWVHNADCAVALFNTTENFLRYYSIVNKSINIK